ncbi:hypothetical protein AAE02nite_10340 [Adhaeribacter aerolatus]|uniref:Uncharacterized protein n=1 Tax=Adhaeribacter aerolatus TaxID=670289 RepID=A0A512AUK7_9BACT|nr:hypothetical protein [Adhaeribacter aerolatus]GEO03370.1 hypothetical protein AAE02nite_10340 [Adhaeribacter aerolatus]
MDTYPNLSRSQQKQIFQYLFPSFQEYETPFYYGDSSLYRAVIETWGLKDHLFLQLWADEQYHRTPCRYNGETASRKKNVFETVQYFFPSASDADVWAIIQQILNSKRSLVRVSRPAGIYQPSFIPMFTPFTKQEDVADDFLADFGQFKGYHPSWALNYLDGRRKKRQQQNNVTLFNLIEA